jgi:hypothetical protein
MTGPVIRTFLIIFVLLSVLLILVWYMILMMVWYEDSHLYHQEIFHLI